MEKKKYNQKEQTCQHRRIKKNYPFGRKSKPIMKCKDCNEVVTPLKLKTIKKYKKKNGNRQR
jgi:hypothetical protein